MKNKNIIIVILVILCLLLAAGVGYTILKDSSESKPQTNSPEKSEDVENQSGYITVDGKCYRPNSDIKAILFMGIDKDTKTDLHNSPGENGQSDSLNLLILNRIAKKAEILQISRDSMVNIDIYGASGDKLMSEEGQIALQYAYGDSDKESCRLTLQKVSELLYGVNIQSYFSLTLDGITAATDAIGGILLTVPEDYTSVDPAFIKGETVNLTGELAEKYVRSRNTEVLDSNQQRMERQSQFMSALIDKLRSIEDKNQYVSVLDDLEPYIVTNMTVDEMLEMTEYEISPEILKVPGEVIEKDGHAQFIVDNKSLQTLILKTFYKLY